VPGVPRVAVAPSAPPFAVAAVVAGGGAVVPLGPAAEALVWLTPRDVVGLAAALDAAPGLRWVQLPSAGVDVVASAGLLARPLLWTSGKGVHSEPVAEHALCLALAGLRSLHLRVGAATWGEPAAETLFDAPVTILGGGGIAAALVRLLAAFRCDVTVVRRSGAPLPGASVLGADRLAEALPGARVVFVTVAATPETFHLVGARELALMDGGAWLVNVARGSCVDTGALVAALAARTIGGAALDVTDPEPLPDGHPLWDLPNCIVTPHTANTWPLLEPALARRIATNVTRFATGVPLDGVVDPAAGY
jgi:phosphoglycerate dehydrogenase-like enzyme